MLGRLDSSRSNQRDASLESKAALNTPSNPNQPNADQETLRALYSLPAADWHKNIMGGNGAPNAQLTDPGDYNEVVGLGSPKANLLISGLINYAGVSLNPAQPTTGKAGQNYSFAITASGGNGDINVTYTIASGAIPNGVTITTGTNEARHRRQAAGRGHRHDLARRPLIPSAPRTRKATP